MHILEYHSEESIKIWVPLWSISGQNNPKQWPPSSPMGLNTINLPSDPLLCSNACLWLPLHSKNSSLPMQAQWPRTGPTAGLAKAHKVPPIHLHFYSLQEIGGKRQNWALYLFRFVSTVGCFQGCRHRWIKEKTTMVLHDPLSAYTAFSFSAFPRKCYGSSVQIWFFFFGFFFQSSILNGLLCSVKLHFCLRTSRWSVSQAWTWDFPSASPSKMKNRKKTF